MCQIVKSFECQSREAVLCVGNGEPFEELWYKQSDIKGSLIWDNVEDGLECRVKVDDFVIWIWIWKRMVAMGTEWKGWLAISEYQRTLECLLLSENTRKFAVYGERDLEREIPQEE